MTYPPPPPQGDWGGQQPPQPGGAPNPVPGFGPPPSQPPAPGQPFGPGQPPAPGGYSPPPDQGWPSPAQPVTGMPSGGYADPFAAPPTTGAPFPGAPQPQPPKKGAPTWLFIVGGVVLLLAIGTGVFFAFDLGGKNDDGKTAGGDSSSSASQQPSEDPATTPGDQPQDGTVVDPGTGLSYQAMGDPWTPTTFTGLAGGLSGVPPVGEELETEPGWVGTYLNGELDTTAVEYDPASLEDSVNALADVVDETNYGNPDDDTKSLDGLKREADPESQEVSIDGKDGIVIGYHLVWDDDAITDQGEFVFVGVLDLGDGRAAALEIALPDSIYEAQTDAVTTAMNSIAFA